MAQLQEKFLTLQLSCKTRTYTTKIIHSPMIWTIIPRCSQIPVVIRLPGTAPLSPARCSSHGCITWNPA